MKEFISLYDLEVGKCGIISHIKEDPLKNRIIEIGLIPGKEVRNFKKAPFGGPLYSCMESFCLAIGKEQAELIMLKIKK